jgi:hypothetical protein
MTAFTATSPTTTRIDLSWSNAGKSADAYRVIIRFNMNNTTANYPADTTAGTLAARLPVDSVSYKHTGLTANRNYWYSLWVVDTAGNMSTVVQDSARTVASPPNPTSSLTATAISIDSVSLAWSNTGMSSDASQFVIRYDSSTTPSPTKFPADTTLGRLFNRYALNVTSAKHAGRTEKRYYWYSIWVKDSSELASTAVQDSAFTPDQTGPSPVPAFTATAVSNSQVNLAWTNTGMSADAYRFIIRYNSNASGTANYPADTNSGALLNRYTIATGSISHTGLTANQYYWYSLWVVDTSGNVSTVIQDSAYTPTQTGPNPAPSFTATAASISQINLVWGNTGMSSNAYRFIIRYTTNGTGTPSFPSDTNSGTLLNRYPIATTSDNHTGLTEKQYYWYSLWVVDTLGNLSGVIQDSAFTPDQTPPNPVATFTATAASKSQINLAWDTTGGSPDAYRFIVRYNTTLAGGAPTYPADTNSGTLLDRYAVTVISASHTGLTEKRYYWYSLWVVDAAGNLSTMKQDSAFTPDQTPPNPMSAFIATASTATRIDLNWSNAGKSSDAYNVIIRYIRNNTTAAYPADTTAGTLAARLPVDSLTSIQSGLLSNRNFWYSLWVVDSAGNMSTVVQDSARTVDGPPVPVPSFTAAAISSDSVSLTWSNTGMSSDASQFVIRYDSSATASPAKYPADTLSGRLFNRYAMNITSAKHSGRSVAQYYWYSIWVKDSSNLASTAVQDSAYTPDLASPNAVAGLAANWWSLDTVRLAWAGTMSADAYRIIIRYNESVTPAPNYPANLTAGTLLDSLALPVNTCKHSGRTEKRYYSYSVWVIDSLGNASAQTLDTAWTPDRTAPNAVVSLTAARTTNDTVLVSWDTTGKSSDANQVVVRYDSSQTSSPDKYPADTNSGRLLNRYAMNVVSAKHSGRKETWYYWYSAWVKDTANLASPVKQDTAYLIGVAPNPLSSFTANRSTKDTVLLTLGLAGMSADARRIMIRYKETIASTPDYPANITDGSLVDTFPKTTTTFKHSGRTEKRYYWYSAWVIDSLDLVSTVKQDSAWLKDLTAPNILASLTATGTKPDTIALSWDTTGISSDAKWIIIRYRTSATPTPHYPTGLANGTLLDTFTTSEVSWKHGLLTGKTYYWYRAWVLDSAANVSTPQQDSAYSLDETVPAAVTGLTANWLALDTVRLAWGGAMSADAYRIIIRYNESSTSTPNYPANLTAGTLADSLALPVTSYKHSGRGDKKYYSYSVWVIDTTGNTSVVRQDTARVPDFVPPNAVAQFTADWTGQDTVQLAWDTTGKSSDANQVVIRFDSSTTSTPAKYPADTLAGRLFNRYSMSVVNAKHGGRKKNWYYWYSIWVKDTANLASTVKQDSAFIPDAVAPGPVPSFTATAVSNSQINLAWSNTAMSSDAYRFIIRYNATVSSTPSYPADTNAGTMFNRYPIATTSASHTSLTEKRYYWYSLWVVDTVGNASTVMQDSAFTPDQTAPSPASALTAAYASASQVNLAWTASGSTDVYRYIVRFSQTVTSTPNYPADTNSGTLAGRYPASPASHTGLTEKKYYWYSLWAVDSSGNASTVLQDSAYLPDQTGPNATPSFTATAFSNSQVDLAWSNTGMSSDAYRFIVRYNTNGTGTPNYPADTTSGTLFNRYSIATTSASHTGLTGKQYFWYSLWVVDTLGNLSARSPDSAYTKDLTPPDTNLYSLHVKAVNETTVACTVTGATAITDGQTLAFHWQTGSYNTVFPPYQGSCNSPFVNPAIFTVTGLNPTTKYFVTASMGDSAGNWSTVGSNQRDTVTTPAPSPAGGLFVTYASAPTRDSVVVSVYGLGALNATGFVDSAKLWINTTGWDTVQATSYSRQLWSDSTFRIGLRAEKTKYWVTVRSHRSDNGTWSTIDPLIGHHVDTARTPDQTAPTLLATFTATAASKSQINLAWTSGGSGDAWRTVVRYNETVDGTPNYPASLNAGTLLDSFPIATPSINHTGLTEKRFYWYSAWVLDSSRNASAVKQDSARTPDQTGPAAAAGFTALPISSTQIDLSWSNAGMSTDAYRFIIRFNTTAVNTPSYPADTNSGTLLNRFALTVTSASHTALTEKNYYWYCLWVVDSVGNVSTVAQDWDRTPDQTVPNPAPSFTATTASNTQINLVWTNTGMSPDAYRFVIRYNATVAATPSYPASITAGTLMDSLAIGVTAYSNSGLTEKRYYWYSLWVIDTSGNASTAKQDSARTPDQTPPNPVSSFAAVGKASKRIDLSWSNSGMSPDAYQFIIRYNRTTTGVPSYPADTTAGTLLGRFPIDKIFRSHTGLTANRYYWYSLWVKDSSRNVSAVIQDSGKTIAPYGKFLTVPSVATNLPDGFLDRERDPAEVDAYPVPARLYQEPVNFRLTGTGSYDALIAVYDLFGGLVYRTSAPADATGEGSTVAVWNLKNLRGQPVSTGGYIAVIRLRDPATGQAATRTIPLAVTK